MLSRIVNSNVNVKKNHYNFKEKSMKTIQENKSGMLTRKQNIYSQLFVILINPIFLFFT